MSKYDKASLVHIPSGYKSGTLYNVLPNDADGDFDFTRASTATRVDENGLIETIATGTPRLNYPLLDGVVQDNPTLLLEPSRQNLFPDSENFSASSWQGVTGGALTANDTTSPDGTSNATKLEGDGTSTSIRLFDFQNFSSAGDFTLSFFAKKGTHNFIQLSLLGYDGGGSVRFDLDNIVASGTGASIINYGNDWYRCIFEATIGASDLTGSANLYLVKNLEGNVFDSNSDANGKSVYIWGAQLEAGSYATSYIPTSGATYEREADVANGAGNSEVFNDSEGVLYANIAALANDGTLRRLSINDNEANNDRVLIGFSPNSNEIQGQSRTGVTTQAAFSGTVSDVTNFSKVAMKYKANDFALWINGFEVDTDVNGTAPVGITTMSFNESAGVKDFYGKTKEIGYYDAVLTDAELEALTSYTSFTNMANELNLTIK